MITRSYKFRFYLNAKHHMTFDKEMNNIHPHTWEILLNVMKTEDRFIKFSELEQIMQNYLSKYENMLLNSLKPFEGLTPSTENIGEIIFNELNDILFDRGWYLATLEISESPSRTYMIQNTSVFYDLKTFPNIQNYDSELENEIGASKTESGINNDSPEITQENSPNISTLKCNLTKVQVPKITLNEWLLYIGTFVILFTGFFLWLTNKGVYPWGSDTWGHLFKTDLLFDQLKNKEFYPLYTSYWYNGIQPFRYWAPLPYYILVGFQLITQGDILFAYYLFLIFIFFMGILSWYLWGKSLLRPRLGLILGILWFFIPDNIRVLLGEGNIPRVFVTLIFPFMLYSFFQYLEFKKKKHLLYVSFYMFLITLTHAMISAMTGIVLFFVCVLYLFRKKEVKTIVEALVSAILGIGLSGFWLFPALQGGILALNSNSSGTSIINTRLTAPLNESLNPVFRLEAMFRGDNPDAFYFGLFILIITILGIFYSNYRSKIYFLLTVMIFAGTTKVIIPLIIHLPLSELFWMSRYTTFAMAFFFVGLLLWEKLKPKILTLFISLIVFEALLSTLLLGFSLEKPRAHYEIEKALEVASSRIGTLDLSRWDSDPSFFISTLNKDKRINQIYGWAWQGATTSQNIVLINTALEMEYYDYVFDRCLELGADTLVAFRRVLKDESKFLNSARQTGYEVIELTDEGIILKYPADGPFGTIVEYKGLAIGSFASNISLIFPQFELGESDYIEDYPIEELLKYETLYLSGFKYYDKSDAETYILELGSMGMNVVIDMTNSENDLMTMRSEFLGVFAQPVKFFNTFPSLIINEEEVKLDLIDQNYNPWQTNYLVNLDEVLAYLNLNHQEMDIWGKKHTNIQFIGINLPYHAFVTQDKEAFKLLEIIFHLEAFKTPKRSITPINYNMKNWRLNIQAEEGTLTDLAFLDAFDILEGQVTKRHNLLEVGSSNSIIKITYPYIGFGLGLSGISLILLIVFYFWWLRKEN